MTVTKECDELDVAWLRGSLVLATNEIKKHKIITTDHNYECTGCRGQLILCRLTHKRFIKSACFRHKSHTPSCKGGGPETAEHYKCKYYMQEYVGLYDSCLTNCRTRGCDSLWFESKTTDKVNIEARRVLDGNLYVYDVLIFRNGKPLLAIEIFNTHRTDPEKISRSDQHGIWVVEVHVEDILNKLEALDKARHRQQKGESVQTITLDNLLRRRELCVACCTRKVLERHVFDEVAGVQAYDIWLDDLWRKHGCEKHHALLLSQRQNFQQLAFRMAEKRDEENKKPYKKAKYEKGMMRKCTECEDWVWTNTCTLVGPASIGTWSFNLKKRYGNQQTVAVCARCTINCEMCGTPMALSQAMRYGLCFGCNHV